MNDASPPLDVPIRDQSIRLGQFLKLADMVDAGVMPGPRVYATGPGVFSGSGIDSREAAFNFIKTISEQGGVMMMLDRNVSIGIRHPLTRPPLRLADLSPSGRGIPTGRATPSSPRRGEVAPEARVSGRGVARPCVRPGHTPPKATRAA